MSGDASLWWIIRRVSGPESGLRWRGRRMLRDATADYAEALRDLWSAAGEPTGAMIGRAADAEVPRLKVSTRSWSDWRNGKNVPSDQRVARFLISYLHSRIREPSDYARRSDAWWETTRKRAQDQRRAESGRGGRPARSHPPIHTGSEIRPTIGKIPRVADHFQHRPAIDQLNQATHDARTVIACHVLTGMGGVGKSQVAAVYARQVMKSKEIDLMVWVTAASRDAVLSTYAQAAIDIFGSAPTDPEIAARKLLLWLESTQRRWMIVLDDLVDPSHLTGLWPPEQANGRVLVTTRRRDAALTASGRRMIDIDVFTPAQASEYLTTALAAYRRTDDPGQIAALSADLGYL